MARPGHAEENQKMKKYRSKMGDEILGVLALSCIKRRAEYSERFHSGKRLNEEL